MNRKLSLFCAVGAIEDEVYFLKILQALTGARP